MIKHAEIKTYQDVVARRKGYKAKHREAIAESGLTREDADAILDEWRTFDNAAQWDVLMDTDLPFSRALSAHNAFNALDQMADLHDIFLGKARYLICDEGLELVSPAAFVPADNVWMLTGKPEVMIQSDTLPKHMPGLVAYDLEAAAV